MKVVTTLEDFIPNAVNFSTNSFLLLLLILPQYQKQLLHNSSKPKLQPIPVRVPKLPASSDSTQHSQGPIK